MSQRFFLKHRLYCPGPTPLAESAIGGLLKTNVYHRTSEFYDVFKNCRRMLAPFFGSTLEPLILTASGTGAMEAAVTNLTNEGDEVVVVTAGKFGERWLGLTKRYACAVRSVEVEWGQAPTAQEVAAALSSLKKPKAVFIHANETSTGVVFPLRELCEAIRRAAPDCLIVVDAISALVAHVVEMDEWGIDCVVAGSQKGFGVPPGLAFINLSERAWQSLSQRPRFYFDLETERKEQAVGGTAWTPATGLVLSLAGALEALGTLGPQKCAAHHQRLAKACRSAAAPLGMALLAANHPSDALTAICVPNGIDGEVLISEAKRSHGAIFAGGQDRLKGQIVRIAHLGYSDDLDLIGALAALEFSLKTMGHRFDLGAGVTAAMKVLATRSA